MTSSNFSFLSSYKTPELNSVSAVWWQINTKQQYKTVFRFKFGTSFCFNGDQSTSDPYKAFP